MALSDGRQYYAPNFLMVALLWFLRVLFDTQSAVCFTPLPWCFWMMTSIYSAVPCLISGGTGHNDVVVAIILFCVIACHDTHKRQLPTERYPSYRSRIR